MRLLLDTGVALTATLLIAAKAIAEDAVVVTTNPRHSRRLMKAVEWAELAT